MEESAKLGASYHPVEQMPRVSACAGTGAQALAAEWLHRLCEALRSLLAFDRRILCYQPQFRLSYSACRPTRTDSQLPAALQGQEHLLLGHHAEEMSRRSVCAVREVKMEASFQGS